MITRTLMLAASLAVTPIAMAGWTIDDGSSIAFSSTKNTDITEEHHFRDFDGFVTDGGSATVNVRLTSVDTGVEVRDQRLRNTLFDIAHFPTAVLQMSVPKAAMADLKAGKSATFQASGALALHGKRVPVKASLQAEPSSDNRIVVTTAAPLMLDATAFSLTDGINQLREMAGLQSIASTIPVSLNLVFKPE
ncbi:YceI family protein [Parathalassolituus penaei]|uniref:YceI family protein n=1 Tax=Parathalassolituus penaei TaxID=2997323 RepID=A0A9X3E9V8_9GAMM|nr:YceI family protein [Parathalassolituus penaei]MCY0963597.1 YceI family protein [Parathalassolituus penaei]